MLNNDIPDVVRTDIMMVLVSIPRVLEDQTADASQYVQVTPLVTYNEPSATGLRK
jgi:hypothetical protein